MMAFDDTCLSDAPITANKFNPTGGEIAAISISFTINIPNQISLMPRLTATGNRNGIVIKRIDKVSRNIPNTR